MRNSKLGQTKKVIYNVLSDGQPHRVSDFFEAAYEEKVIADMNDPTVRNAIFHLKRKHSNIRCVKAGVYQLCTNSELAQEVDDAVEKISQAIAELKCFQWLDCSDDELKQAREINGKLQDLAKKIRAINKKR